jgi:hypothetical protein
MHLHSPDLAMTVKRYNKETRCGARGRRSYPPITVWIFWPPRSIVSFQ